MSDQMVILSTTDVRADGSPLQLCPREGQTRNKVFAGEYVPVAVLSVSRLHDQADWAVEVSIAGATGMVAISRDCTQEQAAEMAWRDTCLAAARLGREG